MTDQILNNNLNQFASFSKKCKVFKAFEMGKMRVYLFQRKVLGSEDKWSTKCTHFSPKRRFTGISFLDSKSRGGWVKDQEGKPNPFVDKIFGKIKA